MKFSLPTTLLSKVWKWIQMVSENLLNNTLNLSFVQCSVIIDVFFHIPKAMQNVSNDHNSIERSYPCIQQNDIHYLRSTNHCFDRMTNRHKTYFVLALPAWKWIEIIDRLFNFLTSGIRIWNRIKSSAILILVQFAIWYDTGGPSNWLSVSLLLFSCGNRLKLENMVSIIRNWSNSSTCVRNARILIWMIVFESSSGVSSSKIRTIVWDHEYDHVNWNTRIDGKPVIITVFLLPLTSIEIDYGGIHIFIAKWITFFIVIYFYLCWKQIKKMEQSK